MSRVENHAARVVNSNSVGSCRTKTTRVTSKGFTARNRAAQVAHARDGFNSKNSRNATRTPAACTRDWKTAADRAEDVPVKKNQPPSSAENNGGRYTAGVTPSSVNPFPAATLRANSRYPTASFLTSGRGYAEIKRRQASKAAKKTDIPATATRATNGRSTALRFVGRSVTGRELPTEAKRRQGRGRSGARTAPSPQDSAYTDQYAQPKRTTNDEAATCRPRTACTVRYMRHRNRNRCRKSYAVQYQGRPSPGPYLPRAHHQSRGGFTKRTALRRIREPKKYAGRSKTYRHSSFLRSPSGNPFR